MGEESSVKLLGTLESPYVMRVRLALKIKGIEHEFIVENLRNSNRSELLVKYNPVHKQVPVLVHNGFPIVDSLIILEYIDETWTDPPHLLPKDPYQRAKQRFWAAYFPQLFEIILKAVITEGETQKIAISKLLEKLDVAEQGMKEIYPNGVPSYMENNVKPGYLEIVYYSLLGNIDAVEEYFGTKLITRERYPFFMSWIKALKQVPEMIEVTPTMPMMLGFLQRKREKFRPCN